MVIKPRREDIRNMAQGNVRLTRAIEALFDVSEGLDASLFDFLSASAFSGRQPSRAGTFDYIDLPENAPHVTKPRRIQWNADDGTLDIGLRGAAVLQVGQETLYYAKNTSGVNISDGDSIMATGALGASGKLTIAKAVADGSIPSRYMIGVATQDIPANAFGYVTSFGLVRGIDTSGYLEGDLLYFDPATPGGLTNVAPVAPNIREPQAIVINPGPGGSGSIFVRMTPSQILGDLQDVYAPSLADGDVLAWDAVDMRWEAAQPSRSNPIATKTADYTITDHDGTILVDASSGPIAITLPSAASVEGVDFTVKKIDTTPAIVTVSGAEDIDGSSSASFSTPNLAITVKSDGTEWWII